MRRRWYGGRAERTGVQADWKSNVPTARGTRVAVCDEMGTKRIPALRDPGFETTFDKLSGATNVERIGEQFDAEATTLADHSNVGTPRSVLGGQGARSRARRLRSSINQYSSLRQKAGTFNLPCESCSARAFPSPNDLEVVYEALAVCPRQTCLETLIPSLPRPPSSNPEYANGVCHLYAPFLDSFGG